MMIMDYANNGDFHKYLQNNFANTIWNSKLIILNKYYIPSCLVLIGDKLIDEDLEIKEHNAQLVKIAFK